MLPTLNDQRSETPRKARVLDKIKGELNFITFNSTEYLNLDIT